MTYYEREGVCNALYLNAGELYHLCSPENFDIIFAGAEDFKFGMSLMGLCAKMFPSIRFFTFELMSNHLHCLIAGNSEIIVEFFNMYKKALQRHFNDCEKVIHWKDFLPRIVPINSLDNLRNVIVYINKNGSVVHPDCTPFSYEWGANRFFFNPEAKIRHRFCGMPMSQKARQLVTRSRKFDNIEGLITVDGYVSPLCFCDIESGESVFHDTRQYFSKLSKNIDGMRDIAAMIGESIFYTDDDLFAITVKLAMNQYGQNKPSLLPRDAKMSLANTLHFDYNASNKQIQRLLRLEENIVNEMFPKIC